jgi:tRNA wybutosine-synthesizing protein 1
MLKHLKTRTVLRITLIRDYNDQQEMIPAFAEMFRKASPHFIEIKSYMHIGRSTNRLEHSNMLEMEEVKKFSEQVAKQSKIFSIMDESIISRISILQNNERMINRWIPTYANTN